MKPVDTGGSIVGRHDGSEYPFSLRYGPWSRIRNLDVLLPDASFLLVESVFRLVANALLLASRPRRMGGFERLAKADAEGVFLVGKLVD